MSKKIYLCIKMHLKKILLFLTLLMNITFAQIDSVATGNIEIFIIDSYISPEPPYKLTLSFFTSDSCTSKVIFSDGKEFIVSNQLAENHKIEIDLDGLKIDKKFIHYRIIVKDKSGEESKSQLYEVEIPQNMIATQKRDVGLLQICCFGGIIFGLPSPTFVSKSNEQYFSLTKEIPIFSFYKGGYNYPFGYIGVEYAHIFNAEKKNFFRTGYKQMFQLNFIKYISIGLSHFTDFKGYNGISSELSLGLLQIQNVFTLFLRYRYNFEPNISGTDFHEASVGLYSNFFSINF